MNRWRTRCGRWEVIAIASAAALLMVIPEAARACEGDEREATPAPGAGRLDDEAARQEYLKKVAALGSDEERSRALVRLLAEAPISEETGAAILGATARIGADEPLYRVLAFFHEIQESDLVRGPLSGPYLDAAARLQSEQLLARALADLLHPREIPGAAVSRALELSQRISSDQWLRKVLREVTDHQALTQDIEAKVRAVAERISSPEVKRRVLSRLERARSGERRHARRMFRLPRFAFRFGDEEDATPPAPPPAPAPPLPPAAPSAPPPPPAPPDVAMPRDGEAIVNGRRFRLSPEQRERIRESTRRLREQMREMSRRLREQMKELRRDLREDLPTDRDDGDMDLDLDWDD